jgi:hypothetical protein
MPNGKPTATTLSPGARSAVERMVAAIMSSGILCACSTARSFSGCTPVIVAVDSRPSKKVTLMLSAPETTCRLVRMTPLSTITTPVPTPRSTSSSPSWALRSGSTISCPKASTAGRQERSFHTQLQLARKHGLPVLLHVRRSVDKVLKHLRQTAGGRPWLGIAHAFNGSEQQAQACIRARLRLGFGGAVTFERALQMRGWPPACRCRSIVMETDAPDIQPHWLYRTQAQRDAGEAQGRNEPAELPRIAQVVAGLRGIGIEELAEATTRNALETLPRLESLMRLSERPPHPA